jgi:GTP-binding protein
VDLHPRYPEIAFLGRSNVGKSSLINALLGRRLARVSTTPGKTRLLNVYEVRLPPVPRAAYLLDLPGYGYARAGKAERRAFQTLVADTLHRPSLGGVVWLLDLRRDPSIEDQAILTLLAQRGAPVLAALTKNDALGRTERGRREGALRAALGLDADQIVLTSARTGDGIADLRVAVGRFVAAAG